MSASAIRRGVATYSIVGFFAVLLAFPFYWMGMTAFKTFADLLSLQNIPFKFNPSPTLENFRFLWQDTHYPRWLLNTALIGIVVVVITLVFSVPAGYALARLSGRWGGTMGIIVFLTYLVPPTLLFLPLSRVISDLGLQDKIYSLMLVYPSFTVPFSTWLLMGFFKTIPRELEDAALVDGCSRLRALRYVVFPISLPGLLTVVIFTFALVVNEYVYAITFISTSTERTISAGVPTELIRGDVFFWGSLMAATLLPAIPLALLYNVFLDRFIAGFTGGAFR